MNTDKEIIWYDIQITGSGIIVFRVLINISSICYMVQNCAHQCTRSLKLHRNQKTSTEFYNFIPVIKAQYDDINFCF